MTKAIEPRAAFVAALAASIADKTFAKLSLGKFRGQGEPRKASATLVIVKNAPHLKLVTRYPRNDETKTFAIEDGINHVKSVLGDVYGSATLHSALQDMTLTYSRKGMPQLVKAKATLEAAQPEPHDRSKAYLVAPDRPYLKALGVTDASGVVKPTMQGKYRQICRFIEIFDGLFSESDAHQTSKLEIVDIGSGKGYLTVALYDHITSTLGRACHMVGIEMRQDLVDAGNRLAGDLDFSSLDFEAAAAGAFAAPKANIVVALHACDTATDDALAIGIHAGAALILSAPCCQHELAPQINAITNGLVGITKFPLLKQRQADLITDSARGLLLEASGYKVKMIEFVSTEHTAKNILIAAVRSATVDRAKARNQYRELKRMAGFTHHHLASQLKDAD